MTWGWNQKRWTSGLRPATSYHLLGFRHTNTPLLCFILIGWKWPNSNFIQFNTISTDRLLTGLLPRSFDNDCRPPVDLPYTDGYIPTLRGRNTTFSGVTWRKHWATEQPKHTDCTLSSLPRFFSFFIPSSPPPVFLPSYPIPGLRASKAKEKTDGLRN